MTAEHLGPLCFLIIEDLYGTFLAHIFQHVANHGRLLAPHIAQRCRVPLRQIKVGLATLIQLRLIQHHSIVDGSPAYQANLPKAYELLRIGKLTSLAYKAHGSTAAKVVEELAAMGFSTVKDLVTAVLDVMRPNDRVVDENEESMLPRKVMNAIRSLVEDDFFARVQPAHFHIPHDARQEASEHLTKNPPVTDSKLKGKKAQDQHVLFVDAEMEQRLDSYLAQQTLRSALDKTDANLNGAGVPGPDDLYICINYSRAVRATRDTVISQHVEKTLGEHYGKVVAAALRQTDLSLMPGSSATPASAAQTQLLNLSRIVRDLSHVSSDHRDGEIPHTNGWHHDEQMTNGITETNGDIDSDQVYKSLAMIADGPYPFLRELGEGEWSLDKSTLRGFLLRQEIVKIARQRVGIIGVRLIRILMDKGRLDERLLQEIGLLEAKELRKTLASLHDTGFVDIQEVPKDPQRQPNRTIFLWFYDEARVQKQLLEEIYKSMARLYQRLQFEREQMRSTLGKVEKYECEGREEEVMSEAELTLLQQFRRKERWLLAELSRLDESVALLRDL